MDEELRDQAMGIYTYAGLEGVMISVAGAFLWYLVGVEGKIQVRGVIENSERYRHIGISRLAISTAEIPLHNPSI